MEYKLTYIESFTSCNEEEGRMNHSQTFENQDDAITVAYDLFYGDFGDIHFWDIKINGKDFDAPSSPEVLPF